MKEYQVTLYCADGRYRPVSCLISSEMVQEVKEDKAKLISVVKQEGIKKICQKRYWTAKDLKKYNYTKVKIRTVEK